MREADEAVGDAEGEEEALEAEVEGVVEAFRAKHGSHWRDCQEQDTEDGFQK